ncbi:MAG TPA: response regulator [Candidatus Tenderia electrophaga]|uniref:Response regulator n=1 Tax=Candidatus Tenderia electrophaga TaxID=1748243 RepID=A0A832J7A2_9GAMM|nr:response regulator [Candidatus Tenderia electrophaga]
MAKQKNILIAEDDASIALAVKTILRKPTNGAYITIVSDGQAALECLQQHEYDLLISDWNMPLLSGNELLAQVRANHSTVQLPFLMLSARPDVAGVVSSEDETVTAYVAKPFENSELVEIVMRLLQ